VDSDGAAAAAEVEEAEGRDVKQMKSSLPPPRLVERCEWDRRSPVSIEEVEVDEELFFRLIRGFLWSSFMKSKKRNKESRRCSAKLASRAR
jgi:hypothetical protein